MRCVLKFRQLMWRLERNDRLTWLFFCLFCLFCLFSLSSCGSNEDQDANTAYRLELDGPQGIIYTQGPWLVRVALSPSTDLSRLSLDYSVFDSVDDEGQDETILVESNQLTVLESGRPDTGLVLLPKIEIGQAMSYTLLLDGITQAENTLRYITRPQAEEGLMIDGPECAVELESPDPTLPLTQSLDQAPEAGVQVSYTARVFPMIDGVIEITGGNVLGGLMSFEWLSSNEVRAVSNGVIATISGGLARSIPLTSPSGEQKLLVTAHTLRSGRCEKVIRFMIE